MAVLPMFHVYGLTLCLTTPVFTAGSVVLMTRFNPRDMLDLLRRTPPHRLPDRAGDLQCHQRSAGKRAADQWRSAIDHRRAAIVHQRGGSLASADCGAIRATDRAKVIEGYGLTEASPVTHACLPDLVRAGSIGLPLPDTHVRVVDFDDPMREMPIGEPGELLINGPQVMTGYYANPEQTSKVLVKDAAGKTWLRTGDIVRMDSDGFFYVLDRKKDMIIRSGMKVYPGSGRACAEPTCGCQRGGGDRAAGCGAYGTARGGDRAQPAKEEQKRIAEELRALCREHLAPYEVPVRFEFMDQLPRSAIGKLLRRELRESSMPGESIEVPSVEEAEETIPDRPSRMSVSKTLGHEAAAGHDSEWRSGNGHDARLNGAARRASPPAKRGGPERVVA